MPCQHLGIDRRERDGVDAIGMSGVARERAAPKHVEAGDGQPLGTRKHAAGLLFAIAPGVAGAGIEQNAHHRQIDRTASLLKSPLNEFCQPAPARDAAGREVAPAAVIGNRKIGIGRTRHVGDVVSDRA